MLDYVQLLWWARNKSTVLPADGERGVLFLQFSAVIQVPLQSPDIRVDSEGVPGFETPF